MSENQELSVQQAIEQGRDLLIKRSSIMSRLVFTVLVVLCCFSVISLVVMLLSMTLGVFLMQWVYRSYMVTKWKIWAFENTRNVHELKAKAILEELMSESPGFLEEWMQTAEDKRRLKELEKKFEIPDVLDNYREVAEETRIDYPRSSSWGTIVFFSLGILVVPFLYWLKRDSYVLILLPLAIYYLWKNTRKNPESTSYILLNDKGIATRHCGFVSWELIEDEQITRENDEDVSYHLFFRYPGGTEKVDITHFPVKPGELYDLLKIYRKRFQDNTNG